MKTPYRTPQVEEGVRNLILQSRAGNRLTLLFHETHTDLEFVYKPNAFRRKDFRARNFSSRDNYTALFVESALPDLTVNMVKSWAYDPFVTRFETLSESLAKNTVTLVNLPDENAFVLAARQPLLLVLRPYQSFGLQDGLLWERFEDRGEEIVSFAAFDSLEKNRFRVLEDGRHVLQLVENDVVLIGGEESVGQMQRVVRKYAGWTLPRFIAHTEQTIRPVLDHGHVTLANDPDFQRVLDINRRLVWSGLDEGGACFGAMNRIYHLIWVRDGAMAAATLARAGWCDPIRIWAPFLLANPSVIRDEAGRERKEFSQLVGTRWSKSEDDGIYYAVLSLFALVQTTGDHALLESGALDELLDILDYTISTRFKPEMGLFGSDVLGEDALASNPYYGYDVVNGKLAASHHKPDGDGPAISYAYSLYQNVNMFNCLRMTQVLIAAAGDTGQEKRAETYGQMARQIETTIRERFLAKDQVYRSSLLVYSDGTQKWIDFAPRGDFWEYSWAVSTGPFLPDPTVSLNSVRMAVKIWPTVHPYGYCPWNFLTRYLKEYGLSRKEYRALMDEELTDALRLSTKYPMAGLVVEYQKAQEGWRGLPFQVGSLNLSVCAQLIQPLAQGLAVRAGDLVDRVDNFQYRVSRIDAEAAGRGEVVKSVTLNGLPLVGSLQIPEDRLHPGKNTVEVGRGAAFDGLRLFSSDAVLRSLAVDEKGFRYEMTSPFAAQLIISGLKKGLSLRVQNRSGKNLPYTTEPVADTGLTLVRVESAGAFTVSVARKQAPPALPTRTRPAEKTATIPPGRR